MTYAIAVMITPNTKAIIASVLQLVGLNITCSPSSSTKLVLTILDAFSYSQDIKIRNSTTTATLRGGRHVVERAEETQPTPNISVQANVM